MSVIEREDRPDTDVLSAISMTQLRKELDRRNRASIGEKLKEYLLQKHQEAMRGLDLNNESVDGLESEDALATQLTSRFRNPADYALPSGRSYLDVLESVKLHPLSRSLELAFQFVMLIEDHIPGYAAEYIRLFSIEQGRMREWEGLPPTEKQQWAREFAYREVLGFVFKWLDEEDTHGWKLHTYCLLTGQDPVMLARLRRTAGKVIYKAGQNNPLGLFTYTAVQERITAATYHAMGHSLEEPIGQEILDTIYGQEIGHSVTFIDLVSRAFQRDPVSTVKLASEGIEAFRMPLEGLLEGSKEMTAALFGGTTQYDRGEAFEWFGNTIRKIAEKSPKLRDHPLELLINRLTDEAKRIRRSQQVVIKRYVV